MKGRNVFLGYYKDPEATASTLQDGWLHSGDLGKIDDEGFLHITGRKKEIIITAGGKNIAPKNIEAALKDLTLVSQAVVIGDRRKYLSALITLDPDAAERFAKVFNLVVVPCVSPWSYEHVQRWNEQCIDPNRSFGPDGVSTDGGPEATALAEEAVALKALVESLRVAQWTCHLDLHETTDADETEYRPAAAARDGEPHVPETVPDGFYLVAEQ